MLRYSLRRLLISIPAIFLIAVFTFSLIRMAPGDPATAMVGLEAQTPEVLAAVRKEWHLNEPLPVQFGTWFEHAVQGDLGKSISARRPVSTLIVERLPVTLELAGAALLMPASSASGLGVASALQARRPLDSSIRIGSLLGVSVPSFVFGILFILIFGLVRPGHLPYQAWVRISGSVGDNLLHLMLPAVALALAPIGIIARLCRSSMLDVLDLRVHPDCTGLRRVTREDHLARRAEERAAPGRHPARPPHDGPHRRRRGRRDGLRPAGARPPAVRRVRSRDYPLVSGVVFVLSISVMFVNLAVDLIYGLLNPRIARSYGGHDDRAVETDRRTPPAAALSLRDSGRTSGLR